MMTLALGAALAGCSALEVKQDTVDQTAEMKAGPESAPHRSITNFSSALRCMDTMMINYAVTDVSVLVEDILDQTKKVNAGTKDMLISAVSEMTRRSRAIRLVAFGPDSNNLVAFLQQAERKNAYAVIPQYDIKGSITQLDENLIRNQKDFGIGYNPYLNLGISKDAASDILGLDLTVLSTDDLSIVPGVTARNSVVIFKQGKGFDGDAAYRKFGVVYSMNFNKSEGKSQALRNLVELAVIELFGKLTKTPYWTCLGADANTAEIRQEVSDWYYAMAANQPELIGYFQIQLRRRGYYGGPVDGLMNPELAGAVARYRSMMALSAQPQIDEEFFSAYLNTDHAALAAKNPPQGESEQTQAQPAAQRAPQSPAPAGLVAVSQGGASPRPTGEALGLLVSAQNGAKQFKRGELVNLMVKPNRDAHVYCYLQDENQKIQRFFPNRFSRDSLVRAGAPLALPGNMKFQIVANDKGQRETVACFASERDLSAEVPGVVTGTDFESLAVSSLERVKEAFARAAGNNLALGVFHVDIR
jgi:hypothetical protein